MTSTDSAAALRFAVNGILFDNDGVLVDSHDAAAVVWNQWATRWAPGFDFHRDIQHGMRLRDVVANLVVAASVDEAATDLLDRELRLTTDVAPIDGAPELAASCPPGSWAVVTSGTRAIAQARLTAATIPNPAAIISAEDTENGKPAPDPYLAGAAALNLHPSRCAVFEDAAAGVQSARAAGIKHVIGVGDATLGTDIDLVVSSLAGISFDGACLTIPPTVILEVGRQGDAQGLSTMRNQFRQAVSDAITFGRVPSQNLGLGPYTLVAITAIAESHPDVTADLIASANDAFLSEHPRTS
jgi:sugar-phosphatase